MAQIPQIVTSPGAVPSTGGSGVRVSPQVNIPTPPDSSQAQAAGAGMEAQAFQTIARSGEKLAQYGEQFADQYIRAKLNVDAADRTADLSKQLHEAEFQSSKIADRDKATADFDARAGKIRDDFAAQDVNPKVRAAVDASLPNQVALRRAATQQASFGLESQAQVGKLIDNINQYNKQAIDSTDPRLTEQLIQQANDAIDGRVAGGWLHADVAAKMKVDFGSSVYRTKIEIAMQKDLASGLALFDATKSKLNAADMRAMAVRAADGGKQLQAERDGNAATPPLGGYGNVSAWTGHIEGAASKTGLPAPLIAAVLSQESGGNANAVSSAGASGPAQLMPGTAAGLGLKPGEEKDPAKAIPAGADYLKQQMDKYGDKTLALMAYNWGPGNVDKWIKDGKPAGAVPAETKNYVDSVLRKEALFSGTRGDALAETNIEYLRNRDRIARSDMDPEQKSRTIAVLDRNRGTLNATVLEERKATKDAAETEIMNTALGKGKDGSFQTFADRYKAAGDFSEAAKWQWFADNESIVKNFYTATPAQQREIAHMAPGAAGVLFQAYLSNQRADRSQFRTLASEEERMFNQGLTSGADPATLANNALRAIAYMKLAGDHEKAASFTGEFQGALKGSAFAKLPPLQRDQIERDVRIAAESANGLSPEMNAILRQLQQGKGKYDEEWKKDPLGMTDADARHITRTVPLQATMTDEQLNGWVVQRARDVALAQQHVDPSGANEVPFLRPNEQVMLSQRLAHANPQEQQMQLRQLAQAFSAVPGGIAKLAEQLHKNDIQGANFANAMALYATGNAADAEIADSLLVASSAIAQGGPAGDKFKLPEKMITMIDTVLDRSRGSGSSRTSGKAIEGQNWGIAARYAYLAQGKLQDQKVIDQRTLEAAIKDVVGTVMKGNDGKEWLIPRDVDTSTFRQGINNIQESDLVNIMPARDGTRATPQMIADFGTYHEVGDGKYQIFFPDKVKGGGAESVLRNTDGRPFVINIRQLINRGGRPVAEITPSGSQTTPGLEPSQAPGITP